MGGYVWRVKSACIYRGIFQTVAAGEKRAVCAWRYDGRADKRQQAGRKESGYGGRNEISRCGRYHFIQTAGTDSEIISYSARSRGTGKEDQKTARRKYRQSGTSDQYADYQYQIICQFFKKRRFDRTGKGTIPALYGRTGG